MHKPRARFKTAKTIWLGMAVSLCLCPGPAGAGRPTRPAEMPDQEGQQQIETLTRELVDLRREIDRLKTRVDGLEHKGAARPSAWRPDSITVFAFPVGESPVKGNKEAWVTIVEVSDFQCPFCKRVQSTLLALHEKYGPNLRFVFKHQPLPFHKQAMPAALATACAGEQGLFWQMQERLFQEKNLDEDNLFGYAQQLSNLDFKRWRDCFETQAPKKAIEEDMQAANLFGARGTPSFFINGRYLAGAQPQERFEALIEEELKKAKESGVPAARYYEQVVLKQGKRIQAEAE